MKDTKTFAEDLFFFANGYVDRIVLKIIDHASDIYENDHLVDMLHEAHVRADKDTEDFSRLFKADVLFELDDVVARVDRYMKDEDTVRIDRRSCLNHASSYHDVCRDLIWEIIGEED